MRRLAGRLIATAIWRQTVAQAAVGMFSRSWIRIIFRNNTRHLISPCLSYRYKHRIPCKIQPNPTVIVGFTIKLKIPRRSRQNCYNSTHAPGKDAALPLTNSTASQLEPRESPRCSGLVEEASPTGMVRLQFPHLALSVRSIDPDFNLFYPAFNV
jgi:hypothetical protein